MTRRGLRDPAHQPAASALFSFPDDGPLLSRTTGLADASAPTGRSLRDGAPPGTFRCAPSPAIARRTTAEQFSPRRRPRYNASQGLRPREEHEITSCLIDGSARV